MANKSVPSGLFAEHGVSEQLRASFGPRTQELFRQCLEAYGDILPLELSMQMEQKLANNLSAAGKYGYGYNRYELKDLVSEFVEDEGIKTRWPGGKPGSEWMKNFIKRHEDLRIRKMKPARYKYMKGADPFLVYDFYQDLDLLYHREVINSNNVHRLYTVAELSYPPTDQKTKNVISRCTKCSEKALLGMNHMNVSVMACIRGDGEKLPPLVVFENRCLLSPFVSETTGSSAYYTASSRYWNEDYIFNYWFENVFIPFLPKYESRENQSIILFLDGCSPRINMRSLSLAVKNKIILMKYPPNLNQHMQPLEKTCFETLRSAWVARDTAGKQENLTTSQKIFGMILSRLWAKHFRKNSIKEAFRSTGVFPLNRQKFPVSAFSQITLRRYFVKQQGAFGQISANLPATRKQKTPKKFENHPAKKGSLKKVEEVKGNKKLRLGNAPTRKKTIDNDSE